MYSQRVCTGVVVVAGRTLIGRWVICSTEKLASNAHLVYIHVRVVPLHSIAALGGHDVKPLKHDGCDEI